MVHCRNDEGEWIAVRYNENGMKEVQRFPDEVRPLQNGTIINFYHKFKLILLHKQSSHPSLIVWRLMYETSQNELKQVKGK